MPFTEFVSDRPGHTKESLPPLKQDNVEITKIPTGGVNVRGRNYLAYISVRHFGSPGQWITNYGGIAYSDDDGQTWVDVPSASRSNTPAYHRHTKCAGLPQDKTGQQQVSRHVGELASERASSRGPCYGGRAASQLLRPFRPLS
jgi:hypothetical protein